MSNTVSRFIVLAILLLASQAWADDMDRYPPPGPDGKIPWVEENYLLKVPENTRSFLLYSPELKDKWDIPFNFTGAVIDPSGVTLYYRGNPYCFKTPTGPGGYHIVDPIKIPGPDGRIPTSPGDLMMPPRVFTDIASTREHLIREWAASGEICRVLDRHFWTFMPHLTLEYRSDGNYPQYRKCSLCDKVETKVEEWR